MDAIIVFGLVFGDEGKGRITDALVRRYGAGTVVRYNGGPQAGHNVISPEGIWHRAAQFGAGTLAGARTIISRFMPVELEGISGEAGVLRAKGIHDPFSRIAIDGRCLVITPGHRLVGRLREILRGASRFGSCGLGVGEAILDAEHGLAITVNDLLDPVRGPRALQRMLLAKWGEATDLPGIYENPSVRGYMDDFRPCLQAPLDAAYARILERLTVLNVEDRGLFDGNAGGPLVFEGAQGALLDRTGGFAPYVTKSRSTWHNAGDLLSGTDARIKKVGVFRAYGHRHGAGPFVTEDDGLCGAFDDSRNRENPWQGRFRVGHLDLVALRYGLRLNDGADMLALTHLDRFAGIGRIRVCKSYAYGGDARDLGDRFAWERHCGRIVITAIRSSTSVPGLPSAADILFNCRPFEWTHFDGWNALSGRAGSRQDIPKEAQRFIRWLEGPDGLNTPVGILSTGPCSDQTLFLLD